ncbi:uncharacterized protein At1g01500-like [Aristolochia californica]|uniref:uncharacterized protein At1g01500-like n=1 Tax=Aristolochia californica TaxID=171875 RepID=UPI0035E0C202
MEVLSLATDSLCCPCRSVGHPSPHSIRSEAFESRVIYTTIVTSLDMQSSLSIVFPPRVVQSSLQINGVKISSYVKISRTLKRHRMNALMSEYIYVNTDRIKFRGSFVPFEIHLQDGRVLVCGILRRGNGVNGAGGPCMWSMECRKGGINEMRSGGQVDVYCAGSSLGKPALLNGVVDFKKQKWKELDSIPEGDDALHDNSKELEGQLAADIEEWSSIGFGRHYRARLEEEEEAQEASWFNAGVRLGVGFGLGVCLGVGVGIGLIVRTSGAIRRLIPL